jgi:hypothetical protein
MPHHVYRLSDDAVPVVVIAPGPLPVPAPHQLDAVRELIGIFDELADAEEAARRLRAAILPVRPLLDRD